MTLTGLHFFGCTRVRAALHIWIKHKLGKGKVFLEHGNAFFLPVRSWKLSGATAVFYTSLKAHSQIQIILGSPSCQTDALPPPPHPPNLSANRLRKEREKQREMEIVLKCHSSKWSKRITARIVLWIKLSDARRYNYRVRAGREDRSPHISHQLSHCSVEKWADTTDWIKDHAERAVSPVYKDKARACHIFAQYQWQTNTA